MTQNTDGLPVEYEIRVGVQFPNPGDVPGAQAGAPPTDWAAPIMEAARSAVLDWVDSIASPDATVTVSAALTGGSVTEVTQHSQ